MTGNMTTVGEHLDAGWCPYGQPDKTGVSPELTTALLETTPHSATADHEQVVPPLGETVCQFITDGVCRFAVEGIRRATTKQPL